MKRSVFTWAAKPGKPIAWTNRPAGGDSRIPVFFRDLPLLNNLILQNRFAGRVCGIGSSGVSGVLVFAIFCKRLPFAGVLIFGLTKSILMKYEV
jgi:hypothetical protein